MPDLSIEGMALAEGVVETIVGIAVRDVEGVASVGSPGATAGLFSALARKQATQGIEVEADENGLLHVAVVIEAQGPVVLPDLAQRVRDAVAEAVLTQTGLTVASVDVAIESIRFE